jgi:hypothetical protein
MSPVPWRPDTVPPIEKELVTQLMATVVTLLLAIVPVAVVSEQSWVGEVG